ncbi:MAG TPA: hypothetical protein VLI04_05490 [Nocardioidaceae bacterium]|nr:hypothetical protein [Nocardioidaceae bacterium]
MWSLFPELLGPMILAFVAGSLVAWLALGMVLRKYPTDEVDDQPAGPRGI